MNPDLSIVIVTYNARQHAVGTIRSYDAAARADPLHSYEVIVVDNDSRDGVAELLRTRFPHLLIVRNPSNVGYARACNLGFQRSRGRYLLFSNPDIEVAGDALAVLISFMDGHPNVGACTPFLELAHTGRIEPGAHRGFPTPWASFTYFAGLSRLCCRSRRLSRLFGRYHLLDRDLGSPHEVDVIEGGFFFVRRTVFQEVGGWDEDFFLFGEDVDLCFRISRRNHAIMYYPRARAHHLLGITTGLKRHTAAAGDVNRNDKERAYHAFYDSMKIFYDKHYRQRYGAIVRGIIFLAIDLRRRLGRRRLTV